MKEKQQLAFDLVKELVDNKPTPSHDVIEVHFIVPKTKKVKYAPRFASPLTAGRFITDVVVLLIKNGFHVVEDRRKGKYGLVSIKYNNRMIMKIERDLVRDEGEK